jgi:hypothetical protein
VYLRIGLAAGVWERSTGVLRNELDETGIQRRGDELARTEVERPLHVEALRLHCLAVDLRHELAFREVERTDRDRVVAQVYGRSGVGRCSVARAHRNQRDEQAQDPSTLAHARSPSPANTVDAPPMQ